VLPGIIGVIQANEALKIVVGYGEPLVGRLLLFDAQSTSFDELKLKRDPECPTCGKKALEAPVAVAPSLAQANGEPEAVPDPAGAACQR
jgi:ThiF family protein